MVSALAGERVGHQDRLARLEGGRDIRQEPFLDVFQELYAPTEVVGGGRNPGSFREVMLRDVRMVGWDALDADDTRTEIHEEVDRYARWTAADIENACDAALMDQPSPQVGEMCCAVSDAGFGAVSAEMIRDRRHATDVSR